MDLRTEDDVAIDVPAAPVAPSRLGRALWLLMIALVMVALVASGALFVDHLKPAPVFCEEGGGCGVLQRTALATVFGIPTPAIGLAGMAVVALTLLWPGRRAPLLTLLVTSAGAFVAVYLVTVQVRMGVYCVFCMTFDSVMIALPLISFARVRVPGLAFAPPFLWRSLAGVALVLAALSPAILGHYRKPHIADAVLEEMEATPGGKVTVIDFVDFQCPYCRMSHESLGPLLARDHDRIRLVRRNVPLTRIHEHADTAARAEVCAEKQAGAPSSADRMAERLFTLPEEELTTERIHAVAGELGFDVAAFDRCTDDPATETRIQEDTAVFKSVGGRGLPLLYINGHRLEGAQDGPELDKILQLAESGQ